MDTLGRAAAGFLALALVAGCGDDPGAPSNGGSAEAALLRARPAAAVDPVGPGRHALQSADGFFYVPQGHQPGAASPLIVLLHGAGGRADDWVGALPLADSVGAALLAPDSRGFTWDAVRGDFGPDVRSIDAALTEVFTHVDVDPARLALGGFSDGASYALSLGIPNGGLFTHLMAFSPGFIRAPTRAGRPLIFITHGTSDPILPIDRTSRVFVPALRSEGYDVTYREFDGGHELPGAVAEEAFLWLTEG